MKKIFAMIIAVCLIFALTACNKSSGGGESTQSTATSNTTSATTSTATSTPTGTVASASTVVSVSEEASASEATSTSEQTSEQTSATETSASQGGTTSSGGGQVVDPSENLGFTVTYVSGTNNAFTITEDNGEYTVTFGALQKKSVYKLSGELNGNIVADLGEDYKLELQLDNFTVRSAISAPIYALSGDKITFTALDGTKNFVYDDRATVDSTDETQVSSAIYTMFDTVISGAGELTVVSKNNNGIHSKDDLEIANLTLSVSCIDNALKGNDSVTITSGNVTAIARRGDGIKTSNSKISNKGNQKGTIAISGGTVNVYAACDGIDSAYNVEISGTAVVKVFTDKYSEYSEEVTALSENEYYIKTTNKNYSYSVKYANTETGASVFKNAVLDSTETSTSGGGQGGKGGPGGPGGQQTTTTTYYYKVDKPSGYNSMTVYAYSSAEAQGTEDAASKSNGMSINNSYDTMSITISGTQMSISWTNKSTQSQGGKGGEGNSDKGDYSTKGIKADNEVNILGGTVEIKAYDDAIHANSDAVLENEQDPLGNVTISGGYLTVYSNDDGIHADGKLLISGGEVHVTNAYEGLESNQIEIAGGKTFVKGNDDGLNAPNGAATPLIKVTGGYLDVTVSPSGDTDGIDSNGNYEQTGGIVITRGPNSEMMAALDYGDNNNYARVSGGTLIILGYGRATTSGSVKSVSGLSLHSQGSHTITVDGETITFNNAYSYNRTTVYSSVTVS